MSWRVPRFGIRHSLRDRGAANVSIQNTVGDGDYLGFVLDERREAMSFSTSGADHHIQVDLGTGYASITVDRMVIPYGHNFDTYDLRLRESSVSDFGSDVVQLFLEEPHSGTAQIDEDLDQESTKRYIRLDWVADNFNPSVPELWLTKTLAPTTGHEKSWPDYRIYNVQTSTTPAGDRGDLQLGASQRVFELEYPNIYLAADIAILDQLVDDVGTEKAFLFDPPFDDEDVFIAKMLSPPERRFAHPVPAGGNKGYTYRFKIVEQLV